MNTVDQSTNQPRYPGRNAYYGTFLTSLFIQGCTVLQGILLARLFGPAGRGEFAAVILWPSIFAGIGILGVNMAIARLAGQGWPVDRLFKTAIRASMITGTLTALVCGLLLPILLPADKEHLMPAAYLFLLYIPLNHLALNLLGIDHGSGNFRWLNATRAALYPVYFSGLVLCWFLVADRVFWAVFSLLVANGAVVLLRLMARHGNLASGEAVVPARILLTESYPFVAASIITILYMQVDKVLLVWLLRAEEIGWYVAAFAAAGVVNVLNRALGIVQFSIAAQERPRYGFALIAVVLRRSTIFSLAAAGGLALLLPWLLPLVYGSEFQPAVVLSYILLPGMILAGLSEILTQALRGQGQPIAGILSKIFGLMVMGLSGFFMAKLWGARGIACGYFIGEVFVFLGLMFVSFRFYQDAVMSDLRLKAADFMFFRGKLSSKQF
ncbi:lipopolysaccharide biosynthesis protein [Desulfofustis glycolicus]|nr:oligosaccharide flippase family protein [Desulfofustis glycolicus]MCB2218440.1 oligosaccharide flippase family protein [Desulfobulbaceae bacterium]